MIVTWHLDGVFQTMIYTDDLEANQSDADGGFVTMEKVYCVISHTHWDREWYKPFEQFRMQLADLINNLLGILEKYPEYIFHLDAQTVVLEDYLEIYPEKRPELTKWIKQGNIVVGPWYLQNDFYLTSGEATVRNLIEGHRIAESFGACGDAGYAPDQFGNISQLPQILGDFGIDNFIFGRGFDRYHKDETGEMVIEQVPSEFIWQGADGTQVLAIHMKYWYNNAQRFSENPELAKKLIEVVERSFEGVAVTPYLLLMNGVDHLEAQENLLPILEKLNTEDINGTVRQIKMTDYVANVRNYINEHQVPMMTHCGELRMGGDGSILQGTLSSRSYLKRLNVLAQNQLENRLEPLYAMLEAAGCTNVYPKNYMRYLWKKLMQNHPHDSICGCSRDEIHAHMEDHYQAISEVTNELMRRGMIEVAQHNAAAVSYPDEYSLVAVNTLGTPQKGMIEAELIFPATDGVNGFTIYDSEGKEVEFSLISREKGPMDVFSPINLPGTIEVERCRVYLSVPETAPFSMQGYSVRKCEERPAAMTLITSAEPILENDFLRVEVTSEGSITIQDKENGRTLNDCIYLEDIGDRGDSYLFRPAAEAPLDTRGIKPEITIPEKNAYVQRCKLSWNWSVPANFDFDRHCRGTEMIEMPIALTLTLKKGDRTLEVAYDVHNTAKDHRVRLIVAADICSNHFQADIPFDVITHEDGFHHPHTISRVHPNTSFAAMEEAGRGIAVFTEGNHECEKIDESRLAFTLFRSTGVINRNWDDTVSSGDQWYCPANQCLRRLEGRMGVCLFNGKAVDAELPQMASRFRNPLLVGFMPCDRRKFSGGRTAVQDSALEELFYRPDPYAEVALQNDQPTVAVEGAHIQVSALKQAEDGNGLVLRFWQYGDTEETVTVTAQGNIYRSSMSEKQAELLGKDQITLTVGSKKIVTLRIQ